MPGRKPIRSEWVRREVYLETAGPFLLSATMAVQETTYEAMVTRLFIITPGDNIYHLVERDHDATNAVVYKSYQKIDPTDNAINIEGSFDNPILTYGSSKEVAVVAENAGAYTVYVSMVVLEHVSW